MIFPLRIIGFLLVCILGSGRSERIQCYECIDCGKMNKPHLTFCPPEPTPYNTTVNTTTTTVAITTPSETDLAMESPLPITPGSPASEDTTVFPETVEFSSSEFPTPAPEELLNPSVSTDLNDTDSMSEHLRRVMRHVNYAPISVRRSTRDTFNYYCYDIKLKSDGTQKTNKGCMKLLQGEEACDMLKTEFNLTNGQCTICLESKCNGGMDLAKSPKIVLVMFMLYVLC